MRSTRARVDADAARPDEVVGRELPIEVFEAPHLLDLGHCRVP